MASFVHGELITADKLNQVANDKGEISERVESTTVTFGPYYMPPGGYFEVKQSMLTLPFIGIDSPCNTYWTLTKLQNGSWTQKDSGHIAAAVWQDRWADLYVSKYGGEGWYRLQVQHTRSGTMWEDGQCWVQLFPWRNNCVRGDWLFHFDNYTSSGNPVGGDVLTADILNSGLVGTKPTND